MNEDEVPIERCDDPQCPDTSRTRALNGQSGVHFHFDAVAWMRHFGGQETGR